MKYLNARLSDSHEYALLGWGQSNARPQGTRLEAVVAAPHLILNPNGIDVALTPGFDGTVGDGRVLTLSSGSLEVDDWIGAQLRLGTRATPKSGLGVVSTNASGTLTITWVYAADDTATTGYLCFDDERGKYYETVRVLTPFQPDQGGAYPTSIYAPGPQGVNADGTLKTGFSVPTGVTSYADFGLFLPLTFLEGVDSHGVCESTDSYTSPATHAADSVTSSTFVFLNAVPAIDIFVRGFITVRHASGISWAKILTNDTTTRFQLIGGWQGAGTPTGTPSAWTWEAFVPHYNNSPHCRLVGFRYPNNDLQPGASSTIGGKIHNRPRGVTGYSYGENFGALCEFGFRASQALGRRVNLVWLGVSGAALIYRNQINNAVGFQNGPGYELGWWDDGFALDWSPASTRGLAARYSRMLTMASKALLAESSTSKLKVLGAIGVQGESDAFFPAGRAGYRDALSSFYAWLRRTATAVTSQSESITSLFTGGRFPFVHQKILATPWENGAGGDTEGLVNAGIVDATARDGNADYYDPEGNGQNPDGHFTGAGEVTNGDAWADKLLTLANLNLAMRLGQDEVDISNLALAYLGDVARVTSLDPVDGSVQAIHCARFFALVRNSLLSAHRWGFANRRHEPVQLSASDSPQWAFAYGLPQDVLRVTAVRHRSVQDDPPGTQGSDPAFRVEQSAAGYRVLRTNQDEAAIRYTSLAVDPEHYPPKFREALAATLASAIAGPIVGGDMGTKKTIEMARLAVIKLTEARESDAGQHKAPTQVLPSFLAGR